MSGCRYYPLCDMSDERCATSAQCAHYEAMPEIVRCRDCGRAYRRGGGVYCSRVLQWGSNDRPAPLPVEPDGFCAWGGVADGERIRPRSLEQVRESLGQLIGLLREPWELGGITADEVADMREGIAARIEIALGER